MLQIRKLSNKTWKHVDTNDGAFILTKFYAKEEFNEFLIVESYGAKRRKYLINEIEVYDIGRTAETFANFEDLFLRLEALKYTGFYKDGDIDLDWGSITGTLSDQTDLQNALNAKQDTLVSGTNIKTINGNSILGSGDLVISNKKSIEYNVTSLCIYNFPATSNWTCQGGNNGMGAYGSARVDSGYSNFLTLIASPFFAKVIGGIAPFDMKLTSNGSFVSPEPNLVGGDLKLVVGYIEFNYSTGALTNATLVDAGTYTPVTSGRVDLREDFGGEITIPKGAIWCYSWAHTKTSAVSSVYIQTILNFEEV